MSIIEFKKDYNDTPLPRTVVFCDFENLFYGFRDHGVKPGNLKALVKLLKNYGFIDSIKVFGNWDDGNIYAEQPAIKAGMSSDIIHCRVDKHGKDFTDFTMLDHIYRTALTRPDVEQYILITGDGHFDNCVSTLQYLDKTVGIVAVKGSLNAVYRNLADWWLELVPDSTSPANHSTEEGEKLEPEIEEVAQPELDQALLDRILQECQNGKRKGLTLTFGGLCRHLSNLGMDKNNVAQGLSILLKEKKLASTNATVGQGDMTRTIKAIEPVLKSPR